MSNLASPKWTKQILLVLSFFAPLHPWSVSQRVHTTSPPMRRWEALAPDIAEALRRSGQTCPSGQDNIQVLDAFDTGGLSVALVDYCQSGASTDSIVAMQLEAGKPVVSRFLKPNGAKLDVELLSGASVMHSDAVTLVPEKKAILHTSTMSDATGRPSQCTVKAYVWNPRLRAFQMNSRASREAEDNMCGTEQTR